MRAPFLVALFSASAIFGVACAPRNTSTHFDRWDQETVKRKADEELDAKANEWVREQVAKAEGAKASATPREAAGESVAPSSKKPPATVRSAATSAFETPEIHTSTRSRVVVRPSDSEPEPSTDEGDDELIY